MKSQWFAFHLSRGMLVMQALLLLWIAIAVLRCRGLMLCTYTEMLPMLAHLPSDAAASAPAVHRPFVRLIAIVVSLAGVPSYLTHVLLGIFASPQIAWRAICAAVVSIALAFGAHVVLVLHIGFGDHSSGAASSYVMQHSAPLPVWLVTLAMMGSVQFSRDPGTAPMQSAMMHNNKSYRDVAIRAFAVLISIAFVIACAVAIGAPVLASDTAQRIVGDQTMSTADILQTKDVHPFAYMSVGVVMELCGILSGLVCSLCFAINSKSPFQRCLLVLPSTVYCIGASLALATFDGVMHGEHISVDSVVLQSWLTALFFVALFFILLQAVLAVSAYRHATAAPTAPANSVEMDPLGSDSSSSSGDSYRRGLIPSRQQLVGVSSSSDDSDSAFVIPAKRRM